MAFEKWIIPLSESCSGFGKLIFCIKLPFSELQKSGVAILKIFIFQRVTGVRGPKNGDFQQKTSGLTLIGKRIPTLPESCIGFGKLIFCIYLPFSGF